MVLKVGGWNRARGSGVGFPLRLRVLSYLPLSLGQCLFFGLLSSQPPLSLWPSCIPSPQETCEPTQIAQILVLSLNPESSLPFLKACCVKQQVCGQRAFPFETGKCRKGHWSQIVSGSCQASWVVLCGSCGPGIQWSPTALLKLKFKQPLKNVFVFNISPWFPIWSKLVVVLLVNFQELGRST